MSSRTIKPVRIESLLAGVLNLGTWLASVVIVAGLVLSLFKRTQFPTGAQVVTAGIGLFILLPILRVILMLTILVKERDCKIAAAAAGCALDHICRLCDRHPVQIAAAPGGLRVVSARIMNALDKKWDALPSSTLPSSVVTHRCR